MDLWTGSGGAGAEKLPAAYARCRKLERHTTPVFSSTVAQKYVRVTSPTLLVSWCPSVPKQHSQMGPSQAHPEPIWGPTLPNWGPTGTHMECCLGKRKSCFLQKTNMFIEYTDYAGLDIAVILCIAWPFSWQIANGNAGPTSALDSMGPNPTFRCHFFNIGPSYKQKARKSFV